MSRADDIRARMESELALADAEDKLVEAKERGVTGDKLVAIKNDLRAKREAYRSGREGDGTANPATVTSTAAVKRRG